MSLSGFHPLVKRWFNDRIGVPTPAQTKGWAAIRNGADTLIAAPTGSGKTLAAFLISLDSLIRESLGKGLPDEVRVIYVSPLKALSADIHRNLAEPRKELRRLAEGEGQVLDQISAAVRTGDTGDAERAAMLRRPPHILVTTPESLYLLLTSERSREMLRTARTVIVDEVHALIETRRGAHLALSLERLDHISGRRLQRIGLSATQRPIEEAGRWLTGMDSSGDARPCALVDEGHLRDLDLQLELPGSPLSAVMSNEIWEEVYDRVAELVRQHRTTIVFVNTRRLAERASRHLGERLGEEQVAAHHGSLSRELRFDAEERLKGGRLSCLVATASLELGIDIGHVDLVCQLGTPRRISTFLQRVGRSGHTVGGQPKGRLFPLSRDELVESTALFRAVRRGELDNLVVHEGALDVLAQQIVAEVAAEAWKVDDLYSAVRSSRPYNRLERSSFDDVVKMLAEGYVTRRGRRAALVHHDAINGMLRGRRGARLVALTSGGAIPENADYRVIVEPEGTFVGTVNEDFAIESMAGDVFQLGTNSWRMLRIERGTVRVEDAHGQPPGIPFWLGEAPARSPELSLGVSDLRRELSGRLDNPDAARSWLMSECGVSEVAALQLVAYLGEARRILGLLPDQSCVLAERFFDESGGMQLVLHSPFGGRVNRAWGLALRKKFCRQFNFELQAAATEEAVLLSLGPQHSFPLDSVFRFLNPATARDVLVQAMLDSPLFATRWRWNANISLAVPRSRGGGRVPPQIQRMQSDDLLAAAFPDAAACLENIPGDREIPDHPLVKQVVHDCLTEAMDIERFLDLLVGLDEGRVRAESRDLPEPSPLAHEILNARPYAFLDDAPLEERRTQAVHTRRPFEPGSAADLGVLDPSAIDRVRDEVAPDPETPDELHDVLMVAGFLTDRDWTNDKMDGLWGELEKAGRATRLGPLRVAREKLSLFKFTHPDLDQSEVLAWSSPPPERAEAVVELVRGRLGLCGPVTVARLATDALLPATEVESALLTLEADGVVLRGRFTPGGSELEWCDRRLLARIHRYTLNRLRAEIEPVSAADFMRFLFTWQGLLPGERRSGLGGLSHILDQLDAVEVPAGGWETEVLSARCDDYDPQLLDMLSLTGRVGWGRLDIRQSAEASASRPIRSTPVALFGRQNADSWIALRRNGGNGTPRVTAYAAAVLAAIDGLGASFFGDLVAQTRLLASQVEVALAELSAAGLVTSDSFAGLRALLVPSARRKPLGGGTRRHQTVSFGIEAAGRWSRLAPQLEPTREESIRLLASTLLRRYGVVFYRLFAAEGFQVPWRELLMVLRRLEARGEIRGGRFIAGVTGEQFALPEALATLRGVRRSPREGTQVVISAADPLNLTGVVLPGGRVAALAGNRILFEDGVPLAASEGGEIRKLSDYPGERALEVERLLSRKQISAALRARLGIRSRPAAVSLSRLTARSQKPVGRG
ncbi:MAG: DEAD/DEAH box helicase [Gemmatimonadota bacterium]